jgi:serine/threonine protein phosphatase 1
MEKFLAIGDIHGCPDQLLEILEKAKEYPDYKLIFLGDYIDRGPDSEKVLNILQNEDTIFLQGNHENMLIEDVTFHPESTHKILQKAEITLKSFHWIMSLHFIYETKDYIFTHAGLSPYKKIEMQETKDYIWTNYDGTYKHLTHKTIVQGHLHKPHLVIIDNHIITDTNCGLGGYLTGVLLPDRVPIQSDTRSGYYRDF